VLLSLVGSTSIVPLPDAINAVSIINVVNATFFLYRRRPFKLQPEFRWVIAGSVAGYFLGMGALTLLASRAFGALQTLLGVSIIVCALLLWRAAKPYAAVSRAGSFALVGGISGILGGLFSSPGPPLVYMAYRQPWPIKTIQESLVFSFGVGAALRLVVMGLSGQISKQAVLLGVAALPIVFIVTGLAANRRPPCSRETLRHVICALLAFAGIGMLT